MTPTSGRRPSPARKPPARSEDPRLSRLVVAEEQLSVIAAEQDHEPGQIRAQLPTGRNPHSPTNRASEAANASRSDRRASPGQSRAAQPAPHRRCPPAAPHQPPHRQYPPRAPAQLRWNDSRPTGRREAVLRPPPESADPLRDTQRALHLRLEPGRSPAGSGLACGQRALVRSRFRVAFRAMVIVLVVGGQGVARAAMGSRVMADMQEVMRTGCLPRGSYG